MQDSSAPGRDFIPRFLAGFARSLGPSEGRAGRASEAVRALAGEARGGRAPGNAVLEARRRVGLDNELYLQTGVMLLWAGDEDEADQELLLFPGLREAEAAAPGSMAEERALQALLDQSSDELREMRALGKPLCERLVYFMSFPEVAAWLSDCFNSASETEGPPALQAPPMQALRDFFETVANETDDARTELQVFNSAKENVAKLMQNLISADPSDSELGEPHGARLLLSWLERLTDRAAERDVEGLFDQMYIPSLTEAQDPNDEPKWLEEAAAALASSAAASANPAAALASPAAALADPAAALGPCDVAALLFPGKTRAGECEPDSGPLGRAGPLSTLLPGGASGALRAALIEQGPDSEFGRELRQAAYAARLLLDNGAFHKLPPFLLEDSRARAAFRAPSARAQLESAREAAGLRELGALEPSLEALDRAALRLPEPDRRVLPPQQEPDAQARVAVWAPLGAGRQRVGDLDFSRLGRACLLSCALAEVYELQRDQGDGQSHVFARALLRLELNGHLRAPLEECARGADPQALMANGACPEQLSGYALCKEANGEAGDAGPELVCRARGDAPELGEFSLLGLRSREPPEEDTAGAPAGELGTALHAAAAPTRAPRRGRVQLLRAQDIAPLGASPGTGAAARVQARVPPWGGRAGLAETLRAARAIASGVRRREALVNSLEESLRTRGPGKRLRGPDADARERREHIRDDALRELAISGDRLYVFLKQMSGTLHGEVNQIVSMDDRSMEAAQRARREAMREERRRASEFSQRVMGQVLNAVFGASKLRADVDMRASDSHAEGARFAQSLVVVSEEASRRLDELGGAQSGLGASQVFQGMRRVLEEARDQPLSLAQLLGALRGLLDEFNAAQLAATGRALEENPGAAALEQLAEPRNSLLIRLNPETFAAIRSAYTMLERELQAHGERDPPRAWQLIEGDDRALSDSFAVLCAYQLSHSRMFSSQASVYVGQMPARINMQSMRVALGKCVMEVARWKRGFRTAAAASTRGYYTSMGVARAVLGDGLGLAVPMM